MVGLRVITVLIVVGLVVMAIGLVGGVRGLYQPHVRPFFMRRRKDDSSPSTENSTRHSENKKRQRKAA